MKLGFLAGAVLATWLSLTYPTQMRAVFEQLVTIVQQITQPDLPKFIQARTRREGTALEPDLKPNPNPPSP